MMDGQQMTYGMLVAKRSLCRNYPRQNKDCYRGVIRNKIKGLAATARGAMRAITPEKIYITS